MLIYAIMCALEQAIRVGVKTEADRDLGAVCKVTVHERRPAARAVLHKRRDLLVRSFHEKYHQARSEPSKTMSA